MNKKGALDRYAHLCAQAAEGAFFKADVATVPSYDITGDRQAKAGVALVLVS